MNYFNSDLKLIELDVEDWQLYGMNGAGLAAHNITQAALKALKEMPENVAKGDGVHTAALKAYKHVYKVLEKYAEYGACDTEPRGVLIRIIEEYTRRRFESEVDLYWEV